MDAKQQLEQFRHNSEWLWLLLRLADEHRREPIRRALREAGKIKGFRVGPVERRLMMLK